MTKAVDLAKTGSLVNSSGQIDLTTGVTGVLPVANGGTGTSTGVAPGGSTTQVQYNNAGAFGGSSSFVFDGTNVGIGTSSPSGKLNVSGATVIARITGTDGIGILRYNDGSSDVAQLAIAGGETIIDYNGPIKFRSGVNGTERMRLDSSGNLGLGVTPSAWSAGYGAPVIETTAGGTYVSAGNGIAIGSNWYYNSGFLYKTTNYASYYQQTSGQHKWFNAPSGTAGNAITFTQAMTLDGSGNLAVGTTTALTTASNRGNITVNGSGSAIYTLGVGGSSMGWFYSDTTTAVINSVGGGTAKPLVFETKTSNGESMRIDSSGKLLTGTSTAPSGGIMSAVFYGATAGGVQVAYGSSGGGAITPASGAGLRFYTYTGAVGSESYTTAAEIDTSANLKFNSGYGSVATAYGCRAWVNFNGTGTVAIRASGNVSSITDHATGQYTVNFTSAMPDTNYAVVPAANDYDWGTKVNEYGNNGQLSRRTTSGIGITLVSGSSLSTCDCDRVSVAIFR